MDKKNCYFGKVSNFLGNMHWYTVQWVKHDVGWSLIVKSVEK